MFSFFNSKILKKLNPTRERDDIIEKDQMTMMLTTILNIKLPCPYRDSLLNNIYMIISTNTVSTRHRQGHQPAQTGPGTSRNRPIQTGAGPAPTCLDRHQSRAGPSKLGLFSLRLGTARCRPVPRRDRKNAVNLMINKF